MLRLSFKTAGVTLGALMRLIPREKVGALGAMWRRRLMVTSKFIHGIVGNCFIHRKLLGAESVGASWEFCAPAVDYDVARKEVSVIFDAKVTEVQGIVAKLLQTQRAAEQALDK